jgi:TonB family protein
MNRILLVAAMALGLAGQALAQPSGIVSVDGRWQTAGGEPLFYDRASRTPPESILCGLECGGSSEPGLGRWRPVTANEAVELDEPWARLRLGEESILTYRGKRVMTWSGDPGDRATLIGAGNWRQVPDIESLHPLQATDPAITRAPAIDPNWITMPDYPAPSRRAAETGYVLLDLCISASGAVVWADLVKSSGYARLDDASLTFALDGLVLTPAIAGPSAVAVCGVEKGVNWTLSDSSGGGP